MQVDLRRYFAPRPVNSMPYSNPFSSLVQHAEKVTAVRLAEQETRQGNCDGLRTLRVDEANKGA